MRGDDVVKIEFPGLIRDELPSGNVRWLCRVEGNKRKRITLSVDPDHPQFQNIYLAARAGIKAKPDENIKIAAKGSLAILGAGYLEHLTQMVADGGASPLTLKQRIGLMPQFLAHKSTSGRSEGQDYADLPADMPAHELIKFRDTLMGTPGKANNMFKMLKAMYSWGVDRQHCKTNPAAAIKVTYKSAGGATAWTLADLEAYRTKHPQGTRAHLCLTLFMFTACRIGDAYLLGRNDEYEKGGIRWLGWQPSKKGSRPVDIPMAKPLRASIHAQPVVGDTYLLTTKGKPYGSAESLRNDFKDWCKQAGIGHLSSHGIRKAAGHLLALHGVTQYGIMSIHGHANASTSQIYTETVERQKLAQDAIGAMGAINW